MIVLSANAGPEDVRRATRAGASGYWTKPLDLARFGADLARRLGRVAADMVAMDRSG